MNKLVTINMPQAVKDIIETLTNAGFEAYAVGGCVRDSILGRIPNDWDITTSALPEDVKKLFRRTIDTGIQHGTVTVMVDKIGYEITTYRIDGKYEDGRHPKEVTFTPNLKEDLLRRDFTINAMAYNDTTGIVDLFGGMEDIENKIIRCVGDPVARFNEDALRLLRAIRFSAQLGYTIDSATEEAIREIAPNLQKISAERIQVELVKTLVSDHPERLKRAYELGLTKYFIPELDVAFETKQDNPHHCYTVGDHIIKTICNIRPDRILRISMLFHDIGKPACKVLDDKGVGHFYGHPKVSSEMAKTILRRLKFDNDTIAKTCKYVLYHDERTEAGTLYMRRSMAKIGEEFYPNLFEVFRADISAQSDYQREQKIARVEQNIKDYEEIIRLNQCVSKDKLAVTGRDLIELGINPGPVLGEIIDLLLHNVIEYPEHNEKEYLLEYATSLAKQKGVNL